MYFWLWKKLDYKLLAVTLLIVAYGFLILYSASAFSQEDSSAWIRQLIYLPVALIFLVIFSLIDYEFWGKKINLLYGFNLILLILVLVAGHHAMGAQRWLGFGNFVFQPSELAKLIMIIVVAKLLSDMPEEVNLRTVIKPAVLTFIPLILILVQPDLGTALVIAFIFMLMLYMKGFNVFYILAVSIAGIAASPFVLKDYQKARLFVFLNPDKDPMGAGWNLIQSKIAIGSGMLFGKGLFASTQGHLNFVPEHCTDFIFTVLAEEFGLAGSLVLLILFALFLYRCIKTAVTAKDSFGSLLAVGITGMFFFHIIVNIGMTLGIMPITGIPLIFMSYGGSSLLTNMMAVGILLSISMRREKLFI
ncbi:MAG: rod shape-determining protein RodA [Armatimonadota bacterium]